MPWIAASLLSALFLGFYDLSTKHAVRDNAVLPVLFLANVCSSLVWLTLLVLDAFAFGGLPAVLKVDPLTGSQHLLLFMKSLLVAASWLCSYFALKLFNDDAGLWWLK